LALTNDDEDMTIFGLIWACTGFPQQEEPLIQDGKSVNAEFYVLNTSKPCKT
ncbi:hypothetical protein CRM22_001264, partial [Opisthorchis felineus]